MKLASHILTSCEHSGENSTATVTSAGGAAAAEAAPAVTNHRQSVLRVIQVSN